ncbi:MAG: GNAT family N-acetyltransferase [Prevotella sp.]|nr:GNAT family N-acetyltransferase [Prevotella sp.]
MENKRMAEYKCLKQQEYTLGDYSIVPLRYEDRFDIMRWRNEQIYHLRQVRPLTEEDQQRYFDNVVAKLFDQPTPDQILFSYLEKGKCIGYGGLVHINWADRHGEISFIMDTRLEKEQFAEHWGNYLTMLCDVAFIDLGLHKIYTYAFDLRPQLYEALEANGFTREVTLKEHCWFEGQYKDVVIHSLINRKQPTVTFREIEESDLETIRNWRNTPAIANNMFTSGVITAEGQKKWFEGVKRGERGWCWFVESEGQPVGYASLNRFERSDDTYEFGLYVGNQALSGGGGGTELLSSKNCCMKHLRRSMRTRCVVRS